MPTVNKPNRPWMVAKPKVEANASRGGNEDTQWYRQKRWQSVRASVLQQEPLCRQCLTEQRFTTATMVDHIKPVTQDGERYDMENLQPMCSKCHAVKSQSERRKP